ncbi:MAG: flavodoxin domain-containing protein [Trichodesmium sp. MO_231.B1]|nr:flavodoxin domain-containing protein [Trichodesmium sp. MO_231.B1]
MKNILILYATREGQTEKVAAQISTHLKKAGASVQLTNAQDKTATENIDLEAFDLLVFGASMHAGGLEKELVTFINSHQEQIKQKIRSFFLVLLSAATKDSELRAKSLEDARKKMDEQIQVPFHDLEMIAGALMYSKYSFPLKWIMKDIAQKAGEGTDISKDYEYTDWQQVAQYSEKLMKT